MPGAGQAAVLAALPSVGRGDPDWAALRLANAKLGGGFQGWLTQEIRVKRGLSYGAGSLIDTRRDAAILMAATQTKNDSAVQVVDLILDQIGRSEAHTSELPSLMRISYTVSCLKKKTIR